MSDFKKYWILGLIIICSISLVYLYVYMEYNVYSWDNAAYWKMWKYFSNKFAENPVEALDEVRHSIRHNDYNCSSILVILIFKLIPLSSRFCYILGVTIAYLVPTVLCFSYLIRKITETENKWLTTLSYIIPATYVAFWGPTLRGYPDICGLVFILLSIIFCLKNNFSKRIDIICAIKLGALLWTPFLLRRWYAYTIISLYVTLPFLNAYYYQQKIEVLKLKNILFNFVIAGCTSVILTTTIQWPLLKTILSTNYSEIYSAYRFSFSVSIEALTHEVSLLFVALVFISSILVIIGNNFKLKTCLVFFWSNLIISLTLFTFTQSPGIQHNLPFSLWMLLIFCEGLFYLILQCKKKMVTFWLSVTSILFMLLCLLQSLFNILNINSNFLLPSFKITPLKVGNLQEYEALSNDLLNLTKNGEKVTIYSSSDILNEEMLETISDSKLNNSINYASQVDLRDNFRVQTLMSDYVVITNPIQTHLRVAGQQVIYIPASSILNHLNIGNAYKKLGYEYKLNNEVSAWIYKKQRPFTSQETTNFFKEFYNHYPKWENLYSNGIINTYLSSEINLGDVWGEFSIHNNSSIYTRPGENKPTIVKWEISGIKKIKISSRDRSCNINDNIIVSLSTLDGKETKTIFIAKGKEEIVDVTDFQHKPSYLEIKKNRSAGCDRLKISRYE